MKRWLRAYAFPAVGVIIVAFLGILAFTGKPPGTKVGHYESHGIVDVPPAAVVRIELSEGRDSWAFRRVSARSWAFDQSGSTKLPDELSSRLEAALRFMHVSSPARTLEGAGDAGASLAGFKLDPPGHVVTLTTADRASVTADFGTLNPTGTSQYVRLVGQPTLYLLPRHVGGEWQLAADMAKRLSLQAGGPATGSRSTRLLLPMSIEEVWAVEIVYAGSLHRFERDSADNWFRHVGRHAHKAGGMTHFADPAKATVIAATLAAFDQTQIEAVIARHPGDDDVGRYGLDRPPIVALMYARDNASPLARVEIGAVAEDGFGRYARISRGGDVVTIAAHEAGRLIELLKAVGATT